MEHVRPVYTLSLCVPFIVFDALLFPFVYWCVNEF
jgi:hypothetical protein